MKSFSIKFLNNQFINNILAFKSDTKIIDEVGTVLLEQKIQFIINTSSENHKIINQIAVETFEKINAIRWLILNKKYGYTWEIKFVENNFTSREIKKFTYYYFIPQTSNNRYLFKYIEIGKSLNKLLKNNTFYFNKPQNFKDNTDCKYQIDTEPTEVNIINFYYKIAFEIDQSLTLEKFKTNFKIPSKDKFNKDLMEHHFQGVFSKLGITCFSEKYNNKLMWDQYADGSKGVCLVFDTTITEERYYSFTKKKVKYFINPTRYFYDATGFMETAHITYAKTKEYSFENEVRELINLQNSKDEQRILKFDPRSLKAIIIGPNSDKADKKYINFLSLVSKSKYKDLKIIETTLDNVLKLKLAKHTINLNEKV